MQISSNPYHYPDAKTYQVVCGRCGEDKYPYRSTPPPDPYICALCLMATKPRKRLRALRMKRRKRVAMEIAGSRRKGPQRPATARRRGVSAQVLPL